MHQCELCSKSYVWRDSLVRHMKQVHGTSDAQPSPLPIIKMYQGKEESGTENEDSDTEDESPEDENMELDTDESYIWQDLITDVYEACDDEFQKKFDALREQGKEVEEAKLLGKIQMLDEHEETLKEHFKRTLVYAYCLKWGDLFDEVKQRFCKLRKKGYDIEEAFEKAVDKVTEFRELLENDIKNEIETDEEDDDEEKEEQLEDEQAGEEESEEEDKEEEGSDKEDEEYKPIWPALIARFAEDELLCDD